MPKTLTSVFSYVILAFRISYLVHINILYYELSFARILNKEPKIILQRDASQFKLKCFKLVWFLFF